jgi:hypothetical protein
VKQPDGFPSAASMHMPVIPASNEVVDKIAGIR